MSSISSTIQYDEIRYNVVLCRYGEIGLKKKNRYQFEERLKDNLFQFLQPFPNFMIQRRHGRFFIMHSDRSYFSFEEVNFIRNQLGYCFGLNSFSLGVLVPATLVDMEAIIAPYVEQILLNTYQGKEQVTYRMRVRRDMRDFPLLSREVEIYFADRLLPRFPQLKLDLDHGKLLIEVELRDGEAFIGFERYMSLAGLPPGTSGTALALLSGGIDSPVAAWLMMGRGCTVHYLTFHSYPYTSLDLLEKVGKIALRLNRYQCGGRLFACNLSEAQKAIRDRCQERFRTLLYRRLMFRIATYLARSLHCEALITGESVGQVASQTLPNLHTIASATPMLFLRPLIGMNKEQTIDFAKRIGTYELSIIDCPDSCTVFQPTSPTTRAYPHLLESEESKLDYSALLQQSLQQIEEISLSDLSRTPFFLPIDNLLI